LPYINVKERKEKEKDSIYHTFLIPLQEKKKARLKKRGGTTPLSPLRLGKKKKKEKGIFLLFPREAGRKKRRL